MEILIIVKLPLNLGWGKYREAITVQFDILVD